jgi:hypothetical protein
MDTKRIGGKRIRKVALVPVNRLQAVLMSQQAAQKGGEQGVSGVYNITAPKPNVSNSFYYQSPGDFERQQVQRGQPSALDFSQPITRTTTDAGIDSVRDPDLRQLDNIVTVLLDILNNPESSEQEKVNAVLTSLRQYLFFKSKYEAGRREADELAAAVPVRVVKIDTQQQTEQQQQESQQQESQQQQQQEPQQQEPQQLEQELQQQQELQVQQEPQQEPPLQQQQQQEPLQPEQFQQQQQQQQQQQRTEKKYRPVYSKTYIVKDIPKGFKAQAKAFLNELEVQKTFDWHGRTGIPIINGKVLRSSDIKDLVEYEIVRSQGAAPGDPPVGYQTFKTYLQSIDVSPRKTSRASRHQSRSTVAVTPVLKQSLILKRALQPSVSVAKKKRKTRETASPLRKAAQLPLPHEENGEFETAEEEEEEEKVQKGSGTLKQRIARFANHILHKWEAY